MRGAVPMLRQRMMLNIPLTSVHRIASPLRYPGGKSVLSGYMASLLERHGACDTYVEPYAGGSGVALWLLERSLVSDVVINDLDGNVHAFWDAAVNHSSEFLRLFDDVEPTMDQWHHWRDVLRNPSTELERGFAFFFLNRTNRSGVVDGGVIGGLEQRGRYRVDARYNKKALRDKLVFLRDHQDSIHVTNDDGISIIERYARRRGTFIYADPPYVMKGGSLYLNSFDSSQHIRLSTTLRSFPQGMWLLTYDDAPLVMDLYGDLPGGLFSLRYSAARHCRAEEVMVYSPIMKEALSDAVSRPNS